MKFHLPIRIKIFLGFASILFLALLTEIVSFVITEQFIHVQTEKILTEKTQSAADQILNFTSRIELDHLGIAREYIISKDTNPQKVEDTIRYTLRQNPFFERILILSTTGRELYKIDRTGAVAKEKLYFELPTDAFNKSLKGQFGISKVYFTEEDTVPHLDVFTPILNDRGIILGVVKGQLRLDSLWDFIAKSTLGRYGFAYVVDEEGRLIAHPNIEFVKKAPILTVRPIIASILHDKTTQQKDIDRYRNEKNVDVIARGVSLPDLQWIVLVEQPVSEAFQELVFVRNLIGGTLIGSVVLLTIFSLVLSENITHPIRLVTAFSKRIKQGQYGSQGLVESGDEVEELATSLNLMNIQLMNHLQAIDEEKEIIATERNKLAVILSGIQDAVVATDLEKYIVLFNPAAERIFGYTAAEVMGKKIDSVLRFYQNKDEIKDGLYAPMRDDQFEGIIYEAKNIVAVGNKDKKVGVNLISGKIKESRTSNLGAILTFHDVSEESKLEEMKVDFVSMAAHELRTPLTIVRGYAQTLYDEVSTTLSPQRSEYLTRILIGAKALSDLMDNLLNVSHIEQGKFKVVLYPFHLEDITRETVASFQSVAHSKSQRLTVNIQGETPMVMADKIRIVQVLSNLIANAINYTPENGEIIVTVRTLTNPDKPPHEFVEVSVKDTGPGIPADALPHLFTKFFRVSGILEQGSKGTGLGLFICKSIISLHHGEIHAESEFGRGTNMIFILPTASEEDMKNYKQLPAQMNTRGIILNDINGGHAS